jgi:hypothetical protein
MKNMRGRSFLVALTIAGLLLAWLIASHKMRKLPPEVVRTSPSKAKSIIGGPLPGSSPQVSPSSKTDRPATYEKMLEQFKSDFRTPINFYGKVIDQRGDPVPDAEVKLSANDKADGRPSEYTRRTDEAGMFSITGAHGITLAVEVSKPGYRAIPPQHGKATSSGVFEYGLSSHGVYQSSENAPTIFVLYKPGPTEPLVKIGEKNFRIARDGSPLSIALDGRSAHQVILRCWNTDLQRPEGQQKYDWRLEITVPNGGLVARNDAFDFEAPTAGYLPTDKIDMSASLPFGHGGWSGSAERSYFLRFADGIFARAKLEMHAGGDHFVVWESFLNPKAGSRNLETTAN